MDLTSIAFPSISTGVYRYPLAQAAEVAVKAIKEFMELQIAPDLDITVAAFDTTTEKAYLDAMKRVFQ